VARERSGQLHGIAAVIDKDLAAALLARQVGADVLLILTDVPKVYLGYRTPEQRGIDEATVAEMEAFAAAGEFAAARWVPRWRRPWPSSRAADSAP
jgi:carbamate kinase